GVCECRARDRSEDGLEMATVAGSSNVKIPTLAAKNAARMGHPQSHPPSSHPARSKSSANGAGRFGPYGGRYVPETLMAALEELELAYEKARRDKSFQREVQHLLTTFAGRPTTLTASRANSAAPKFTSSAKTCSTPERIRSTTPSARQCSRAAWARNASSL